MKIFNIIVNPCEFLLGIDTNYSSTMYLYNPSTEFYLRIGNNIIKKHFLDKLLNDHIPLDKMRYSKVYNSFHYETAIIRHGMLVNNKFRIMLDKNFYTRY